MSVIVITSGKGGVGKTTATANIGAGLARMDRRVALIDADIGLRNLDVVLGLENRIIYDVVDVAEGLCNLHEALIRDKHIPGLFLLAAAQTRDKTALMPEHMENIVCQLKQTFDYVLIDCPAGIEHGFRTAVAGADRAIIVTTPELPAVRDADRVVGLLEAAGIMNPDLIVNRMRQRMVRRGDLLSADDVENVLAINVLGVVPDDDSVVVAVNRGEPAIAVSGSQAGRAFTEIAGQITGQAVAEKEPSTFSTIWRKLVSFGQ